jgi:hypothetical protein
MACVRKVLSPALALAKTNAVFFVIPTHFPRLMEHLNATPVTLLRICFLPKGHHIARIIHAAKHAPTQWELIKIAAMTALPAIAIL